MRYIVFPQDAVNNAGHVGGKAYNLARLSSHKIPVPPWFVLVPGAFLDSLKPAEKAAFESAENHTILKSAMSSFEADPRVIEELSEAVRQLCEAAGEAVAVRSSALDEDGLEHSFAGMLESDLLVTPENVVESVIRVWFSAFSEHVLAYRQENNINRIVPPAILVQRMVYPDIAGVAFSADPVALDRSTAVVSSVWGLGDTLVSGESDADAFYINSSGAVTREYIANKAIAKLVTNSNGSPRMLAVELPEKQANKPSLTHAQARLIAQLARQCESIFGQPQDIEFAIAAGKLYVLQSRPISTLTERAQPAGQFYTHLNHTLVLDDWHGETLPLTFSVVRRYYAGIYRQFVMSSKRLNDVPPGLLESLLSRLMVYLQGKVYVNQTAVNDVWSIVPEYAGLRQFLHGFFVPKTGKLNRQNLKDYLWILSKFFLIFMKLPSKFDLFLNNVNSILGEEQYEPETKKIPELVNDASEILHFFKYQWDAPALNDYLSGLLYKAINQILVSNEFENSGALLNDMMHYHVSTTSSEAAAALEKLAEMVARDEGLLKTLQNNYSAISEQKFPEFYAKLENYLERFSDRCAEDLKLESASLRMDPLPVIENIIILANVNIKADQTKKQPIDLNEKKQKSTRFLKEQLKINWMKKIIFFQLVRFVRKSIWCREEMRFGLTRLFGRLRIISNELGLRFEKSGLLEQKADIHYLYFDEIFEFIGGQSINNDLKKLVKKRILMFQEFRQQEELPDELSLKGMVPLANKVSVSTSKSTVGKNCIKGVCAANGVARGPVRFVNNIREHQLQAGDILIAKNSDPAFVAVFSLIAGALFEQGSPLAHTAIVARELNVPMIVSVKGLRDWVQEGEWVEINGEAGTVRKINPDLLDE